MDELNIRVYPETALRSEPGAPEAEQVLPNGVDVSVRYTRELPAEPDDNGGAEGADEALVVLAGAILRLSRALTGALTIGDYKADTQVELRITTRQGVPILIPGAPPNAPARDNESPFVLGWQLTPADVAAIRAALEPELPATMQVFRRRGRFLSLGDSQPDYRRMSLLVSVVTDHQISNDVLTDVFGLDGFGTSGARLLTNSQFEQVSRLPLGTVHRVSVGIDGTFEVAVPVSGNESGWVWLLVGSQTFIGMRSEPNLDDPATEFTILLPQIDEDDAGGGNAQGETARGSEAVPMDASEDELLSRPDVFSDDPGTYCRPFTNPHRVIGERRFHSVLRVDQPEIGGGPSLEGTPGILGLDLLGSINLFRPGVFIEGAGFGSLAGGLGPGRGTPLLAGAPGAGVADNPLISTRAANQRRRTTVLANSVGRRILKGKEALDWEGDSSVYQAMTLGFGHILEHRVRWRSNGYSLGNVSHTLTLAPRQTKRIVTVQSEILDRVRREESTEAADRVYQQTLRDYSYDDAVQSHLGEWARGGSRSQTTGAAGGFGFALPGFVIGGGASHGRSSSSSWSEGGRTASASEHQGLRDAIRQYGESLRKLESLVVVEQSQEEFVQGVSEVIRNPNYGHSLTVIYHEILRHLRIDTEIVGARECVFVPLAIRPFTLERALRWREFLERGLRKQRLRWAMRHLEDVKTDFAGSSIPLGARSTHPINFVSGSLYIQLAIERPKDNDEGDFDEARWLVLAPFLHIPILGAYARLKEVIEARRDAEFQRNYAPTIAARWVNTLTIKAGAQTLDGADFTLASSYTYNGVLRIDFTYNSKDSDDLTRDKLTEITVKATESLSAPSVANLKQVQLRYYTDTFDNRVASSRHTDDLIDIATGTPESVGATVIIQPTSWEQLNLRDEIKAAADELIAHLNEHVEYYHKLIWWRMDRDKLYMLLDSVLVSEEDGRSVASVAERNPVAILGNSLVYRVAGGAFLRVDGHENPEALNDYYRDTAHRPEPIRVSLPTSGLYAQAIMDRCEALEEHMGSTDWVLSDSEPELEDLGDLLQSRRADLPEAKPTEFPASIINLQNVPNAPPPSGFADILNAVQNAGAFRDMAGLAETQANARAAMESAAGLANQFGARAVEMKKAEMATNQVDRKLASIRRARERDMINDDDVRTQANRALGEMNTPPIESPPEQSTGEIVESGSEQIRRGGVDRIEARSLRPDGSSSQIVLASNEERRPLQERCGFFGPGVVISEGDLRDAIRLTTEAERQNWFDAAGNALAEDNDLQFGHLVRYWLARFSAIWPSTLTSAQAEAMSPGINYGQLLDAAASNATVAAEVARVRADLLAGAPGVGTPANLNALFEEALSNARESREDTRAWSAVFVVSCIRRVAIQLGLEAESGGVHMGRDGLLLAHEGHRFYVVQAYRRRFGPDQRNGTYHAFRPGERAVQVGDIIVVDRQANAIADVVDFNHIPGIIGGRALHCDIVVDVNIPANQVVTIGGNLSNAVGGPSNNVRRRRYPLNADGRVVVDREQLFTQEADDGNLPDVPVTDTSAGLHERSTGRIFALLSPVELCAVVPGQQVNGGVVV